VASKTPLPLLPLLEKNGVKTSLIILKKIFATAFFLFLTPLFLKVAKLFF
jgi:hypothetical protein